MKTEKTYQILNILGLVYTLALNTLANVLPFNGQNTGEVSAKYDNLFVPAGYTFSIWSLIYLLLLGFVVYQSRGLFGRRPAPAVVGRIGPWFFVSCLANGAWMPAWHYERLGLALVIMLVLLVSLIVIYPRREGPEGTTAARLFARLPFSVYLGWISVATIANTAAWLTGLGWSGGFLSPSVWTAVVLLVGAGLGLWFLLRHRDIAYALVVVWALTGILNRRLGLDDPLNWTIIAPLVLGLGVLAVGSLIVGVRQIRRA